MAGSSVSAVSAVRDLAAGGGGGCCCGGFMERHLRRDLAEAPVVDMIWGSRRRRSRSRDRSGAVGGARGGRGRRRRDFFDRFRRREKGSDLQRRRRRRRPIVLLDEIPQILIAGDRDQRVEILRRKLASETHRRAAQLSQLQHQLGKGNGAIDGEDAGLAAEVTELAVGVTGEDFAAVATEELDGGVGGGGDGLGYF